MYIEKEFRFEASHILPRHSGKCSRLHGHSWRLKVGVWGGVRPSTQFVMDYAELKRLVQPLVDLFDHRHLNCFIQYPSSENVATYIAHELFGELSVYEDYAVQVSETENTWAGWSSMDKGDVSRFDDLTAEWRAPQLVGISDVPKALEEAQGYARVAFDQFQANQIQVEQLQLYMAKMNFNPDIPKG